MHALHLFGFFMISNNKFLEFILYVARPLCHTHSSSALRLSDLFLILSKLFLLQLKSEKKELYVTNILNHLITSFSVRFFGAVVLLVGLLLAFDGFFFELFMFYLLLFFVSHNFHANIGRTLFMYFIYFALFARGMWWGDKIVGFRRDLPVFFSLIFEWIVGIYINDDYLAMAVWKL